MSDGDALYEAGDVNTVAGGADDVLDDLDEGFHDDEVDVDHTDAQGDANRVDHALPLAVLTYLARSLAAEPDSVVVESENRRGEVLLRLSVAPDDMGRVIGRRGRTAQAIRTLVNVAGARDGIRTSVDIVDD
jgi:uncharacterized protein